MTSPGKLVFSPNVT